MGSSKNRTSGNRDRSAQVAVWSIWAGMLALLLWSYLPISSPVPLAEDWYTVPLLTGQQVNLPAWLWEQNNEHRMPVARLLLLTVLEAAEGDFRAGGLLNLTLLAAGAAAAILFARHLRGRTDVADAYFPLVLLHFGHAVDVLFPFQITFILSLTFILLVGCALFLPASVSSPSAAALAGSALLMLPLSGFIGLLFVPTLAAYVFFAGWCCSSGSRGWPRRPRVGAWLMATSAGAFALGALYFVGYEHPSWNAPNPGIVPSLKVVLKVLSLAFGPAAYSWWEPAVLLAMLFLGASCWRAFRRLDMPAPHRDYAFGAGLFATTALGFAAAVGWGRAGSEPDIGLPLRYVSIAIPAFVASYLTWVVSASRTALAVQRTLALVMLLLVPINTVGGHRFFADWYADGMKAVHADLQRGVPVEVLAERHQRFLVHWWTPTQLAQHMRMLRDAGIPPFDRAAVAETPGR